MYMYINSNAHIDDGGPIVLHYMRRVVRVHDLQVHQDTPLLLPAIMMPDHLLFIGKKKTGIHFLYDKKN